MWATGTPVLDFWWCLPWFSKPGYIPYLHASLPTQLIPQIHLCVTPTNILTATITTKPFWSSYFFKRWWKSYPCHSLWKYVTDKDSNSLSHSSLAPSSKDYRKDWQCFLNLNDIIMTVIWLVTIQFDNNLFTETWKYLLYYQLW